MSLRVLQNIAQYLPAPWLVVGLLILGFAMLSLRPKDELQSPSNTSQTFPQVFMNKVETREFDQQGKLHYQLVTPNIAHYQVNPETSGEGDYTLIDAPRITFYDSNGAAPWQVSSTYGRSEHNNELIRLLDNVAIEQESPTQGLLQITTDELHIRARQQFAETDKAVKMRSARGRIDAIGMSAQLAESRIQLKSQVKAVYEPR